MGATEVNRRPAMMAAKIKAPANTFNSVADELLVQKRAESKAARTFDKSRGY